MIAKLEKAIEAMADKAASANTSGEAMQFAQAACNLANALATAKNTQKG